jgi:hypothetical protein
LCQLFTHALYFGGNVGVGLGKGCAVATSAYGGSDQGEAKAWVHGKFQE